MSRSRNPRTAIGVAVLAAAVVVALATACGDESATGETSVSTTTTTALSAPPAQPFQVAGIPAGFVLAEAGRGAWQPEWGSDSVGTTEPVTLFALAGQEEPVAVSVTGVGDQQGGFYQSSGCYFERGEKTTVDDREAIWCAPTDDASGNELLIRTGDDFAIRVLDASKSASRDEMEDIYRATTPNGRTEAPSVDLPTGSTLIGSLDADAVMSAWGGAGANAFTAKWTSPDSSYVTVQTLPADAADLDALAAAISNDIGPFDDIAAPALETEIAGRPAVTANLAPTTCALCSSPAVIYTTTPSGDLLAVYGYGDTITLDVLNKIAESATGATPAEWDAFIAGAATRT